MIRRSANRPTVYCPQCPGHTVLPTHDPDIDTKKCVRCQGERAYLPLPHPDSHLCEVCQRECPECQALTGSADGRKCRACKGLCRTCDEPLRQRPDYASEIVRIEPGRRKDHRRKWTKTIFPRSWGWDQCPACRHAQTSADPVRAALAALPDKVVRACGGNVPPTVVEAIQTELHRHITVNQLTARIERRWWNSWADRPLQRDGDGYRDGYRPDDVALWLVVPSACAGRCEDGWHRAGPEEPDQDDVPCSECRGGKLLPRPYAAMNTVDPDAEPEEREAGPPAAAQTLAEAVTYRPPMQECTGRDGACGVPVAAPYTQCPACLDWPWCHCGRRRYDPNQATACRMCTNGIPA